MRVTRRFYTVSDSSKSPSSSPLPSTSKKALTIGKRKSAQRRLQFGGRDPDDVEVEQIEIDDEEDEDGSDKEVEILDDDMEDRQKKKKKRPKKLKKPPTRQSARKRPHSKDEEEEYEQVGDDSEDIEEVLSDSDMEKHQAKKRRKKLKKKPMKQSARKRARSDGPEEDEEVVEEDSEEEIEPPPPPPPPFHIDFDGNRWDFLCQSDYLVRHYPLLGLQQCYECKDSTVLLCAERYTRKCPYLLLALKKNRVTTVYSRFEHRNHPVKMTAMDMLKGQRLSPKKTGPDADFVEEMELNGWKLAGEGIRGEESLAKLLAEKGVRRHSRQDQEKPHYRSYLCGMGKCKFKMRWMKRRAELWQHDEHGRHQTAKRRRRKNGRY